MSSVYQLTNKVTFARAVVIARNEDDARRTHPSDDLASRGPRGWRRWRSGGVSGGFNGWRDVAAPVGWPVDLDLVDVTLLAQRAHSGAGDGPQAYQASEELRALGEGPDESWGGRSLRELGGAYADHVDEDTGSLFDGSRAVVDELAQPRAADPMRGYLLRRAQDALDDPEMPSRDVLLIDAAMRLGAIGDVDPVWLRWSAMLGDRGLEGPT